MNHSLTKKATTALTDLISTVGAETCSDILDEFWECWITSPTLNHTNPEYRAERLIAYKCIRKLLKELKQDGR